MAQARGDLTAADQAYTQSRAIIERLAARDPANTSWQRELAVAHSQVGVVAQARGDLTAADQAYTQYLAISERLAALDPANTDWQQNLAVAHAGSGDVAQARGDLTAADQAYTQYLGHLRTAGRAGPRQHQLAAEPGRRARPGRGRSASPRRPDRRRPGLHPGPGHLRTAGRPGPRQHGLAAEPGRRAHLVGDLAQARGDLTAADQAYTQYLAISERLAALDPANTSWQRELAVAHSRVGVVAQARGDLTAADQAYTQYLAIIEAAGRPGPRQHGLAAEPGRRASPGR